jgi:hypothetical protein
MCLSKEKNEGHAHYKHMYALKKYFENRFYVGLTNVVFRYYQA